MQKLLPFLAWWPLLNRQSLRADLIAGLTGALIIIPQGMAFAQIAGMPPEYGLYACMVPAIVAALFGSSRHLVTGPSTTGSLIVFAALSPFATAGSTSYITLALTLALMTGVMQILLGLLRMGALVNFVSQTVILGYVSGAAVWIFSSQVKNFLGIEIPRGLALGDLWRAIYQHLGAANPYVATVGAATLLTGLLIRHYAPRLPYMIAAILTGAGVAAALNALFGSEATGIRTLEGIHHFLPPLSLPDPSPNTLQQLWPIATLMTLLTLTEAVTIARAIGLKSGQSIDNNQLFIGQGLANIAGSFFSAYPSSGSFNRTGANYQAGAQTPMAAILAALLLVALLGLVAPWVSYLPTAAMAGILFIVAWGLIDRVNILKACRADRQEASIFTLTFLATLYDLRTSIFIGLAASLAFFIRKTSRPTLSSAVPNPDERSYHFSPGEGPIGEWPQLHVVRVDGAVFFGSVHYVGQCLDEIARRYPERSHLLILARGISYLDYAGAELLAREARRRRAAGGGLYFYRLSEEGRRALEVAGSIEAIGRMHLFEDQPNVVARIRLVAGILDD